MEDSASISQIGLILNNRTDTWHQFWHDLSDSDKMNYVLKWCSLPHDFQQQYDVSDLTEASHQVVTPLTKNQTELVFIFQNGLKFTVLVSGGRPS